MALAVWRQWDAAAGGGSASCLSAERLSGETTGSSCVDLVNNSYHTVTYFNQLRSVVTFSESCLKSKTWQNCILLISSQAFNYLS